jgi:hypothetical protein
MRPSDLLRAARLMIAASTPQALAIQPNFSEHSFSDNTGSVKQAELRLNIGHRAGAQLPCLLSRGTKFLVSLVPVDLQHRLPQGSERHTPIHPAGTMSPPPSEVAIIAAASAVPVPSRRLSHPDCRSVLTLIVASKRHPKRQDRERITSPPLNYSAAARNSRTLPAGGLRMRSISRASVSKARFFSGRYS